MLEDSNQSDRPRVGHWRSTALVAGVVLGAYGLLLNPYWTPGGDSEMFISAARSIARGEGNTYNGKPVYVSPPAWSYVMAGAMWVSPTFLMIKLVALGLMAGAWTMAHRVMLRLGPAHWATWSAILTAILVPVYSLTFWLHSEPLFCALAWGAALLGVRAAEDRRRTWEILGVILLCGAMASVRWTSGLQWGIVAAILAGGWRLTREGAIDGRAVGNGRLVLGAGLSGAATVLIFIVLFLILPKIASGSLPIAEVQEIPPTSQDSEDATPDLVDNTIFQNLSPLEERLVRLVASGHWLAWTLWYPARFAGGISNLSWISLAAGWIALAMLVLSAWRAIARRGEIARWPLGRFLWPALLGYLFLLVLIWPLPNARYLVPIAPAVLMSVLWGCCAVGEIAGRRKLGSLLGRTFIASLLIANGAMLAIDIRIQRSGDTLFGGSAADYYANYEAGLHSSLLKAIDYLRARGIDDGDLAVSERYSNLNRPRFSKAGPRNVVMLADRQVLAPPIFYSFVPNRIPEKLFIAGRVYPGGFREWAARNDVKFYLYQQPTEPWRLWHFRVPADLQSRLSGAPPPEPTFGWLLFSEEDGFEKPVELPKQFEAPRRIPGL